jgi:hypothetical protein
MLGASQWRRKQWSSINMTTDDVRMRVEEIRAHATDDECAHSLEDSLYDDLMRAIATGQCTDAAGCAEIALTTKDIDFARWCA